MSAHSMEEMLLEGQMKVKELFENLVYPEKVKAKRESGKKQGVKSPPPLRARRRIDVEWPACNDPKKM